MKATELMIGDWVRWLRYTLRVDAALLNTEFHDKDESNNFKPIPLTPELLEKNGFNHVAECEWEYNDTSCSLRFAVSPEEMGKERIFAIAMEGATFDIEMTMDYVHELQHALRLCGIEKEIAL